MTTAFCIPDDCHQTLLYEKINNDVIPFIRRLCVDRNGNTTTTDYKLTGETHTVTGEVVTDPGSASCCHSVTLYEQKPGCLSIPFIRQYQQNAEGELNVTDYSLDGQPLIPTEPISSEPFTQTTTHEQMCDATNRNTFFRWYVSCGNTITNTYDTDLNGTEYTASDATYAGDCLCKPLTLKRELCDNVGNNTLVKFIRTSKYNGAGDETSTIDTTLDGDSYLVQGSVGACKSIEPVTSRQKLCDITQSVKTVRIDQTEGDVGPKSWTLSNGLIVSNNFGKKDPYGYGLTYAQPCKFTFSEPVTFGFYLYAPPLTESRYCKIVGEHIEMIAITPYCEWDPVGRTVRFKTTAETQAISPDMGWWAPVPENTAPYFIQFRTITPVTELIINPEDTGNLGGCMTFLSVYLTRKTPFWRTITYDDLGQAISQIDTTMDDAPYTIQGQLGTC